MEVIGSGLEAGLGSGSGDPNITATQSLLIVRSLAATIIMIVSMMVLVTIVVKKSLHKKHYVFVASLMVNDIVVALSLLLVHIVIPIHNRFAGDKITLSCQLTGVLSIAPIASELSVVCLAVDAVLALKKPFKYHTLMTKPVMCLMISTTWIIVAVVSLPILVADELDVQAEELQLCPTSFCTLSSHNIVQDCHIYYGNGADYIPVFINISSNEGS